MIKCFICKKEITGIESFSKFARIKIANKEVYVHTHHHGVKKHLEDIRK